MKRKPNVLSLLIAIMMVFSIFIGLNVKANAADAFQTEVVRLVNVERAKIGLPALTETSQLDQLAIMRAQDMASNRNLPDDHNTPTLGYPIDTLNNNGVAWTYIGENIAWGQNTPAEVVAAWMNSPSHRANILNVKFTEIGIGYIKGNYPLNEKGLIGSGIYWSQLFINPGTVVNPTKVITSNTLSTTNTSTPIKVSKVKKHGKTVSKKIAITVE